MLEMKRLGWGALLASMVALGACGDDGSTPSGDSGTPPGDSGTPSTGGTCVDVCSADADCGITLVCDQGRCGCDTDERCQASAFESEGCTSNDDCTDSSAPHCVEWAGSTYCSKDDSLLAFCSGGTKQTLQLADGTGSISRCMFLTRKCDAQSGTCINACEDDFDCQVPGRGTCDVATGRCVCEKTPEDTCTASRPDLQCLDDGTCGCLLDEFCDFDDRGATCNTTTGQCECATEADCGDGFDVCVDNQCRCSSDMVCSGVSSQFPGTTVECR